MKYTEWGFIARFVESGDLYEVDAAGMPERDARMYVAHANTEEESVEDSSIRVFYKVRSRDVEVTDWEEE